MADHLVHLTEGLVCMGFILVPRLRDIITIINNHHPYRRSEYLLEEFKNFRPPTFDGETKKSEDTEAWLHRMKKFSRLHNYS